MPEFDCHVIGRNGQQVVKIEVGSLGGWLARLPVPTSPIAYDVETSGIRPDSGARVTAISVAYHAGDRDVCFAAPLDTGWDRTKTHNGQPLPHHSSCPLNPKDTTARERALLKAASLAETAKTPKTREKYAQLYREAMWAPKPTCVCPRTVNASPADWTAFASWLRGASHHGLVGHNGRFDQRLTAAGTRHAPGFDIGPMLWDTMLAQAVMEPTESVALKSTAKRLLGADATDEQEAMKASLKLNPAGWTRRFDLDWDTIGPYAARDALLTLQLFDLQQERLDTGECWPRDRDVCETETALSNVLHAMESRGVELNVPALTDEGSRLESEAARLAAELPFPATPAGAVAHFFADREPLKTTATGRPAVDREVIAELVKEGVEWAAEYQRVMGLRSMLSKFYASWADLVGADGRLRTSFKQTHVEQDFRAGTGAGGTVSGRLSSSEPNLQQCPKPDRIRVAGVQGPMAHFRAKPGHVLFEADVSGAEAKILCWYARIESMRAGFEADMNIHDMNTRAVFGIEPDHPEWKQIRHVAKTLFFSIIYGAGVRRLAESSKLPMTTVKDFRDGVFRAYPEIRRLMKQCEQRVESGGALVLAGGRRRPHSWNEASFKAANSLIQGSQAMALRPVILRIEEEFPGMLVSSVHDSVWVEAPADRWEQVGARVQTIIKETFEGFFSAPDFFVKFSSDVTVLATDSEGFTK